MRCKPSVSDVSLDPGNRSGRPHDSNSKASNRHVINRADGKLMGSYGRVGHQLGEFYNLHFIGIDSKGNVYSAEVQGKRVQKFRNLGGL
jgi:hypothetical protein